MATWRKLKAPVALAALAAMLVAPVVGEEVHSWPRHAIDDEPRGADGTKLADFNGDGLPDIVTGWEESGITRLYLHPGAEKVRNPWPAVTVGKTPAVEDALPVDLDCDGRLEIVSMCEGNERCVYTHRCVSDAANLLEENNWQQQPIAATSGKTMWMFAAQLSAKEVSPVALALGAKGPDAAIGLLTPSADDTHESHWRPLSPVGWTMSLSVLDMDGDGDKDILLSDRRGELRGVRWLENPAPSDDQQAPWKNHFVGCRDREVMFLTVADGDADGRDDIFVAVKPASVAWFRRTSESGFSETPVLINFPDGSGTAKAVAADDFNKDGIQDLVITCEGATQDRSGVWWLQRDNAAEPASGTWHNISGPDGIKFDLVELVDLDRDGDLDVLTCEERFNGRGLGVIWYENPAR